MKHHLGKIAITLTWLLTTLTSLIERYVWTPAEAVWFVCVAYHLALGLELFYRYRTGVLSWFFTRQKLTRIAGQVLGAVLLLAVATNTAKATSVFFWMPQAVMALVLASVVLNIVKYSSKLGIITPSIAQFLETKINSTTQKLSQDDASIPAPSEPVAEEQGSSAQN